MLERLWRVLENRGGGVCGGIFVNVGSFGREKCGGGFSLGITGITGGFIDVKCKIECRRVVNSGKKLLWLKKAFRISGIPYQSTVYAPISPKRNGKNRGNLIKNSIFTLLAYDNKTFSAISRSRIPSGVPYPFVGKFRYFHIVCNNALNQPTRAALIDNIQRQQWDQYMYRWYKDTYWDRNYQCLPWNTLEYCCQFNENYLLPNWTISILNQAIISKYWNVHTGWKYCSEMRLHTGRLGGLKNHNCANRLGRSICRARRWRAAMQVWLGIFWDFLPPPPPCYGRSKRDAYEKTLIGGRKKILRGIPMSHALDESTYTLVRYQFFWEFSIAPHLNQVRLK